MANTITFPPVSGGGGGTGDATWGSITGVLDSQVDLRDALNGKQATLVSGTNIKTIDGQDILGSGDLDIAGEYYKKTETYSKVEVDTIIADIPPTDLSGYYNKTETETLLSNKIDKEVGKGLSTNDFTDAFKQALESNKVQNVTTDSVNKKLVVTYTDGTFVDLNLDDVVTDVRVEGATLDATTSVLTIVSSDGGAYVTVDLSVFVTNQTLSNALVGKADKIHTHSTFDIDGLDIALSNKVTKNEAIIGATKTKITYDSNGLVINGADLSASDIPNLPQSKIINLETNLSNKIDKGVGVVGDTKTKVTYNNDGIITGGADLEEADLPSISQAKITNLVSDLSNKQPNLISGTNIKTINGESVLGSGDIVISSGGTVDLSEYYKKTETYNKTEVDTIISNIPETDLTNYYNKTQVDTIALDKVDKVVGKQLSTEDYTTVEKTKLSGLSNYVKPASEPISYIDGLQTALGDKVDKVSKQALDSNNALRVTGTTVSLYKGDGTFDSITTQDTVYTLPKASATVLGGIKVGTNLSIDANGVLSANDTNVSFTEISNKPTNLSGYGITDAYTKTEVDTMVGNIASTLDTINGQVI